MALDSSCVNGGRLTVSIGEELKLQKILVPTDLSKNSATADKSFLDFVSKTVEIIPIGPGSFAPVAIGGVIQIDDQVGTPSQFRRSQTCASFSASSFHPRFSHSPLFHEVTE